MIKTKYKKNKGSVYCLTFFLSLFVFVFNFNSFSQNSNENLVKIEKLYLKYKNHFPSVEDITPNDLKKITPNDLILIDVRSPEEQKVSIIPKSITKEQFETRKQTLKNKKIVIYCTIGYRSGIYAKELKTQGINALNLRGGIVLWTYLNKNLVTQSNKETNLVHVYGKKWNLIHPNFDAVW